MHYPHGPDVVADVDDKEREPPPVAIPTLRAITEPCVVRERCRLRRLRVL